MPAIPGADGTAHTSGPLAARERDASQRRDGGARRAPEPIRSGRGGGAGLRAWGHTRLGGALLLVASMVQRTSPRAGVPLQVPPPFFVMIGVTRGVGRRVRDLSAPRRLLRGVLLGADGAAACCCSRPVWSFLYEVSPIRQRTCPQGQWELGGRKMSLLRNLVQVPAARSLAAA